MDTLTIFSTLGSRFHCFFLQWPFHTAMSRRGDCDSLAICIHGNRGLLGYLSRKQRVEKYEGKRLPTPQRATFLSSLKEPRHWKNCLLEEVGFCRFWLCGDVASKY